MKPLLTPFFLLALLAGFTAGCGSSTNTVTVGLKIELTGIDRAADGSTQVSWRVVNPNVVPYLVAKSTHRITLDGVFLGTVSDPETVAVTAQGSLERRHPLVPAGPEAVRALSAAAAAGTGAYRVDSLMVIRLYGEETDKGNLTNSGRVPVTGK